MELFILFYFIIYLLADKVMIGSKTLAFNWFKRSNTTNHGISIIGKLHKIVASIAQINQFTAIYRWNKLSEKMGTEM